MKIFGKSPSKSLGNKRETNRILSEKKLLTRQKKLDEAIITVQDLSDLMQYPQRFSRLLDEFHNQLYRSYTETIKLSSKDLNNFGEKMSSTEQNVQSIGSILEESSTKTCFFVPAPYNLLFFRADLIAFAIMKQRMDQNESFFFFF